MEFHSKNYRNGFNSGLTKVTDVHETNHPTGIGFNILRLKVGEDFEISQPMEVAILHMQGDTSFRIEGQTFDNRRNSLFDEPPFAIHAPLNTSITITANTETELALFETENEKTFPFVVYFPEETGNEHRGKGLVDDASLRFVRTIFDGTNSHPNTELVLGEVVNFPGRWSSYPPHHHPQPEIYHYRFTDPRGYGHAELGEDVLKVKQFDTVKILHELDHSQCAAPGYGMYYFWVIRHLPNCRYTVPEFTEDHRWTMEPHARFWSPKEEALV